MSEPIRVQLTERLTTVLVAGSIGYYHLQTGRRLLLSGEVRRYEKGQFVASWDKFGNTTFWECRKDCRAKPSAKRPEQWKEVHYIAYVLSVTDEDGDAPSYEEAQTEMEQQRLKKALSKLRVPSIEEVRTKVPDPNCLDFVLSLPMSWEDRLGPEPETIH